MRTILYLTIAFLFSSTALNLNAQIDSATADSLIRALVLDSDTNGVIRFKPNTLKSGDILTLYNSYFVDDKDNEFVKFKSHVDPFVGMTHDRYKQYYKGIPVEPATMIEHHQNGFVYAVNGIIAGLNKPMDLESIGLFDD